MNLFWRCEADFPGWVAVRARTAQGREERQNQERFHYGFLRAKQKRASELADVDEAAAGRVAQARQGI